MNLINGDFYDELKKISHHSVDMILTDLPYNMTSLKWDTKLDLKEMWNLFDHVLKDNGAIVLTASQPFTSRLVQSKEDWFKHEWIWQKTKPTNFMSMKSNPAKIHESVLVFGKGKITYNPQMWQIDEAHRDKRKNVIDPITNKDGFIGKVKRTRKADDGSRYPHSIIKVSNPINKLMHPTQKPIQLFEYLIKTYSNKTETVLDCCAGSGTTAIACMNTQRRYICIEKESKYFDIMNDRINLEENK